MVQITQGCSRICCKLSHTLFGWRDNYAHDAELAHANAELNKWLALLFFSVVSYNLIQSNIRASEKGVGPSSVGFEAEKTNLDWAECGWLSRN